MSGFILEDYRDQTGAISIPATSTPWEMDPDAEGQRDWDEYSWGNRCPTCGERITNHAKRCRWCQPKAKASAADLPRKLRRLQDRARQMADGPRRELVRMALVATMRDIVAAMVEEEGE